MEYRQELLDDPMNQKICRTIAAIMLAALPVVATEPYLPFVGPPPLRFASSQPATNETSADKPVSSTLKVVAARTTTRTNGINNNVLAAVTNTANTNHNATTANASLEAPSVAYQASRHSLPNTSLLSPGDLTSITPEMLMDYFKPVGGGTNGAAIYSPVKVWFTPPMSPAPVQSRATYTTK